MQGGLGRTIEAAWKSSKFKVQGSKFKVESKCRYYLFRFLEWAGGSWATVPKSLHAGCALRTITMHNFPWFRVSRRLMSDCLEKLWRIGGTGVSPVQTEWRARRPPHRSSHNLWVGQRLMSDCSESLHAGCALRTITMRNFSWFRVSRRHLN